MTSLLDRTKFISAPPVMPVGVIDSTPPEYAEEDVVPWRIDPLTGGLFVRISDEVISLPLSGDPGVPVYLIEAPTLFTAPDPNTTLTFTPADDVPAPAVRVVPTGAQLIAGSIAVVPATEYTATTDPSIGTNTKAIVVRELEEGWLTSFTDPTTAELTRIVKNTRGRIIAFRIINPTSNDLYLTFHDAVDDLSLSNSTLAMLPFFVPKKLGIEVDGLLEADFARPIGFANGIVMAISTTSPGYTAGAVGNEVFMEARYK